MCRKKVRYVVFRNRWRGTPVSTGEDYNHWDHPDASAYAKRADPTELRSSMKSQEVAALSESMDVLGDASLCRFDVGF